MTSAPLPRLVLAALLAHALINAGTHLSARAVTATLAPASVAVIRMLGTAVIYGLLLALLRPGPSATPDHARRLPPRALWPLFLAWGFVVGPLNQGLFLVGIARSNAAHAALLYALTPVAVSFAAAALGRERLRGRRLLGVLVALTGVVVLLLERGLTDGVGQSALEVAIGDALILGAVLAWAAWTLGSGALAARWSTPQIAGWTMLGAGFWAALAAPFVWQPLPAEVPSEAWMALAWLVLMTSVVSYLLWSYALSRTEASRVAVFTNLQPLGTAALAWLLLDEPIGLSLVLGGALVILGVRQVQRAR
jgi:drug/metabolite transporter (DMT)-like permease